MSIGTSKKTYQPKPDKVIKLSKYHAQIKDKAKVKCNLFIKSGKIILIMILFQGCSAQWHLKRAIKKDPTILTKETIIKVDTLIRIDSVRFKDTLTIQRLDTIKIEKERLRIEIIRQNDTFLINTLIKADTIRLIKEVKLPPQVIYRKAPISLFWRIFIGITGALIFAMILGYLMKRNEK